MSYRLEPLPLHGPIFNGAIAVYGEAFAEPPYSDPDRGREIRARLLDTHSLRPGYNGLVALDERGAVVGMTYGYHGAPGQWWHDAVASRLDRDTASRWLGDSYEVVEVAVAPARQAKGIGAALVGGLLKDRPEATAVLSTRTDSRAQELYRRLGFQVVLTMPFIPGGPLFHVMGRRLPWEDPQEASPG